MALRKIWIWMKRFRHRRGYGVHSPFAFNLITYVIYCKNAYYAYEELSRIREEVNSGRDQKGRATGSTKRYRLLFRLANFAAPAHILSLGTGTGLGMIHLGFARKAEYLALDNRPGFEEMTRELLSCYLPDARYINTPDISRLEQEIEQVPEVGIVHINHFSAAYLPLIEKCMQKVSPHSLFIVEKINQPACKEMWEKLKKDERSGNSFDLHETGLLFFDKKLPEKHYIVNF